MANKSIPVAVLYIEGEQMEKFIAEIDQLKTLSVLQPEKNFASDFPNLDKMQEVMLTALKFHNKLTE